MHDIIHYSTSICPFESGKCGKGEEKTQKSEYLENEKSFVDEIKKHFSLVLKGYHLVENKNLIKNSGHKLKGCFQSSMFVYCVNESL